MQIGQEVSVIDPGGIRHVATITKITGAGESARKVLNVQYTVDGEVRTLEDVPNQVDTEYGKPMWLFKGEKRIHEEPPPPPPSPQSEKKKSK